MCEEPLIPMCEEFGHFQMVGIETTVKIERSER
jgi:hypothetical protein